MFFNSPCILLKSKSRPRCHSCICFSTHPVFYLSQNLDLRSSASYLLAQAPPPSPTHTCVTGRGGDRREDTGSDTLQSDQGTPCLRQFCVAETKQRRGAVPRRHALPHLISNLSLCATRSTQKVTLLPVAVAASVVSFLRTTGRGNCARGTSGSHTTIIAPLLDIKSDTVP